MPSEACERAGSCLGSLRTRKDEHPDLLTVADLRSVAFLVDLLEDMETGLGREDLTAAPKA